MTIMGFDFGLARIGVALGNCSTQLATPLTVIHSSSKQNIDWLKISALIKEWRPKLLIVGMPKKLDGSESAMCATINQFALELEKKFALPVRFANEQLSSVEANERLKNSRQMGRKKRIRKEEIDQVAAAIILENWMTQPHD